MVERSGGVLELVPFDGLWEAAGVIADTFPLDRESSLARPVRQFGHWVRLVLVDRALTNSERTAMLTLSEPSPLATGALCLAAAGIAPRLPRWLRWSLLAGLVGWAVRGGRLRRFVVLRGRLREVARDALLVGDYISRESGAAVPWVTEAFDAIGQETAFALLLPGSADERRNQARERIYTRRFGFRVAARTTAGDEVITILVRDRAPTAGSLPGLQPRPSALAAHTA